MGIYIYIWIYQHGIHPMACHGLIFTNMVTNIVDDVLSSGSGMNRAHMNYIMINNRTMMDINMDHRNPAIAVMFHLVLYQVG